MSQKSEQQVIVIGAGIIGVCCANALIKDGWRVTLVDDEPPGMSASYGNAGGFGVAEVAPISMPGVIWNVPRWLMDPLGPLAIRWSYFPKLIPWLYRFWRAGSPKRVEQIAAALATLLKRVRSDYDEVIEDASLQHLIKQEEALVLYRSQAAFHADDDKWQLRRRHGIDFKVITGDEVRQLEPAVSSDIEVGVKLTNWNSTLDPYRIVSGIYDQFIERGGCFHQSGVSKINASGELKTVLLNNGEQLSCDKLVIAAGAWSHILAKQIGDFVSLETERGYSLTLPDPGVNINRMMLYPEQGFVMTPMNMGLRLSGTVELGGLKAEPTRKRSFILADKAKTVLPGLRSDAAEDWMGHRPATPDSLPVISESVSQPGIFYAFGHGHLGLTLGATTAKLISDLMANRKPIVDPEPFSIKRFN